VTSRRLQNGQPFAPPEAVFQFNSLLRIKGFRLGLEALAAGKKG